MVERLLQEGLTVHASVRDPSKKDRLAYLENLAEDVLAERAAPTVRYALGSAHYRSSLDVTTSSFDDAESALERIAAFRQRVLRATDGAPLVPGALPDMFVAAMDDDLNVPQALAVLHEHVRSGNVAVDAGDIGSAVQILGAVTAMLAVLGLPTGDAATSEQGAREASALDALVQSLIVQRAECDIQIIE